MIDELLRRRALIVVGKGGVGRTSVSGALAILRAAGPAGPNRVLAMEYDRLGALAIAMGRKPGFDPAKVADPCQGENIYSNHGRGIYLINQLMDEVQFHKNGTEIHMLKR